MVHGCKSACTIKSLKHRKIERKLTMLQLVYRDVRDMHSTPTRWGKEKIVYWVYLGITPNDAILSPTRTIYNIYRNEVKNRRDIVPW